MKKQVMTSITTIASICLVVALVCITPGLALSKVSSEDPASATDVSAKLQSASKSVAQNDDDQGEDNDDQVILRPASSKSVAQNDDDQGEDNDDQVILRPASSKFAA